MIFEDNSQSPKIIKGLSFKDILKEDGSEKSSDVDKKQWSPLKRNLENLKKVLFLISQKILFVKFFVEFIKYLLIRSRVILTIASVINDLFSGYFDFAKRFFVNKLFWGRGKLLRFTAQFLGVFLLLFTFVSYTYKTATLDSVEHNFEHVYAAQQDLLIQGASTNTEVPDDRRRIDSEEYLVKTGDTLSTVAEYYGLELETLLWANDLEENSIINPGESLEIPPGDGLSVKAASGDTLESLAKKYESSPQMIIDVNWLDYPFDITAGQELFIPDGKKPEPPTPAAPVYSGMVYQRAGNLPSSPSVAGVDRFLHWPVQGGGRLLQCYSGWHNGVDISAPAGTNAVASAAGTVTFAGCQSGGCPPMGSLYGGWGLAWTVVVDHGNGISTVYGHLRNIYVSSGQAVSRGQALAEMGATGTAYGVHIHYMVLRGGGWMSHVNPAPYMVNNICGY
jgi:murein DD-endopeptidase MepM/ murein hydrolase activator NlpD